MSIIETIDDLVLEVYAAEVFRRCDSDDSVRASGLPEQARQAVDCCLRGGTAAEAKRFLTSTHSATELIGYAIDELGHPVDVYRWLLNPWPNSFAHTYLWLRQIHPELRDPTPAARILRLVYDGADPGHAITMCSPLYGAWLDLWTVTVRRPAAA